MATTRSTTRATGRERALEMEQRRTSMASKRFTLGMRSTIKASIMFTKMEDEKDNYFRNMHRRHPKDAIHVDPKYEPEMLPENIEPHCTEFHDDNDPVLEPDFKRHKIPLQVRCLEMYSQELQKYGRQFKREIQLLIDNQPNADCAWQFVRTMAYTTLWPPLHTRKELKTFETYFCKLTPKEKRRYDRIMSTNFT
ncbi:hypothetical protein KR018_010547 [Drosophila ironensis]|nr:hypothetical protein KR018_010547 [Drosophila ironensis]